MRQHMSLAEVEAVFAAMELPLIQKSIEEIQTAKEQFGPLPMSGGREHFVHRLTVSGGTGVNAGERKTDAKLEQCPI